MTVEISATDLLALANGRGQYALVDVREEGRFVEGHLLKASSIPLRQLETDVPTRIPVPSCPVVLCDGDAGPESRAAETRMRAWGYQDVRILAGGVAGWRDSGMPVYTGMHTPSKAFGEAIEANLHTPGISPQELARRRQASEPVFLIDCRPHEEYLKGTLPGSINVPGVELFYRFANVVRNPEIPVVVHCAGRTRSIVGAQSLRDAGVPNPVYALENGTMGWLLAGFNTEKPILRAAGFDSPPQSGGAALEQAQRIRTRHAIATADATDIAKWCSATASETTYLIDVRTAEEFAAGHHPCALHGPGGQLLQATDKYLVVQNARVVVADDNGVRASMTAGWLKRMGWSNVVVWPMLGKPLQLVGGAETRRYYGGADLGVRRIGAARLAALIREDAVCILDLDTSLEYEKAHLPGAAFVKRRSLERVLQELGVDRQIVLSSSDGVIASLAAAEAAACEELSVLDGGKSAWAAQGFPMSGGQEAMLDLPDDVWRRPVEAPGDPVSNMNQYLSWEIGLMDQIRRDSTVRFEF